MINNSEFKKSKKTIAAEEFYASLDPNLTAEERGDKVFNYFYNTNYEDLAAQTHMDDADARVEAFVEAFYYAVNSDEEPWRKKGFDMVGALISGNVEFLLAMMCGWGAKSIAKIAMLTRDEDYRFHDPELKGKLIVYWSNGNKSTCRCLIDVATHGVWGYSPHIFKKYKNGEAEIERVCIEVSPIDGGQTYEFSCISWGKRNELHDDSIYWYTPDPKSEPYEYEP